MNKKKQKTINHQTKQNMKTYIVKIEISIDETLIANGLDPSKERVKKAIEDAVEHILPHVDITALKAEVKHVEEPTWTIKELEDHGMI